MEPINDSSEINEIQTDWTVIKKINGLKQIIKPGDYVQPCNNVELLMAKCAFYNTQTTVQAIWLRGNRTIDPQNVKTVLGILARKIPHLRFCLAKLSGRIWFKLMKEFVLDFETTSGDVMDVFTQLLNSSFDLWKGPLWKVRLIQNECNTVLIFSIQHSITDGITNVRICRETVKLLNQLTSTNKIEASLVEPLCMSPNINETYKHLISSSYLFLVKYYWMKVINSFTSLFTQNCKLEGTSSVTCIKQAKTKVLIHEFTEIQTKSLLSMCKSTKITMNSLMTTLNNLSLLMSTQSERPLKRFEIKTAHCINLRRHMAPDFDSTPGCFISWLESNLKMSLHETKNHFWETAKWINENLKRNIEEDLTHLKILPIVHHIGIWLTVNYHLSNMGLPNKLDVDYVSTNLGNLDQLLQPDDNKEEIEIVRMIRASSSHYSWTPFVFAFHTFRGKLTISYDYFTNKVSEVDIKELFRILCDNTSKLATKGNVD